jgi:ribosome modulation factor
MLTILTFSRSEQPVKRRRKDRDPWIEGYEASAKARPRSYNPYDSGRDSRRLWDDGWMEAQMERLPLRSPRTGNRMA